MEPGDPPSICALCRREIPAGEYHGINECGAQMREQISTLEAIFEAAKLARRRGQATPELIEALNAIEPGGA